MQFEEGLAYFYWKMLECFLEFSFFPPALCFEPMDHSRQG